MNKFLCITIKSYVLRFQYYELNSKKRHHFVLGKKVETRIFRAIKRKPRHDAHILCYDIFQSIMNVAEFKAVFTF